MSVFSASMNHRSFYPQISILCFVLGLLLAAAIHSANQINLAGDGGNRAGFLLGNNAPAVGKTEAQQSTEQNTKLETEIKKLRARSTELEKSLESGSGSAKTLGKELQELKLFSGLTEAVGPGVTVTLSDSLKRPLVTEGQPPLGILIHDRDIATVVNELKASGAEAVSVNGQRVVGATVIRCVGPVVQINGSPTTPPYVVSAIGDVETMYTGLNLPGGVLDELRQFDPNMIHMEKKKSLHLPAYAGSTQVRFAQSPKTASSDSKDK